MPAFQHPDDIVQPMALGLQEDQVVEEQVGTLPQKQLWVVVLGLYVGLPGLLSHLLGDFVGPLPKQGGYMAVRLFHGVLSRADDLRQGGEKTVAAIVCFPPTGSGPQMAGRALGYGP